MSRSLSVIAAAGIALISVWLPSTIAAYFTAESMAVVTGSTGDWLPGQVQVSVFDANQERQLYLNDNPTAQAYSQRQLWRVQLPVQKNSLAGLQEPQLLFWCGETLLWGTNLAGLVDQTPPSYLLPLANCLTSQALRVETKLLEQFEQIENLPLSTTQVVWLAAADRLIFESTEPAVVHAQQSCESTTNWWATNKLGIASEELGMNCQLTYWSVDAAGNASEPQELWLVEPPIELPAPPELAVISIQNSDLYLRLQLFSASIPYSGWQISGKTETGDRLLSLDWQVLSLDEEWPFGAPLNLSGDTILKVNVPSDVKSIEVRQLDQYGRLSLPIRHQLE